MEMEMDGCSQEYKCPQNSEEGIRSLETGIKRDFESPNLVAGCEFRPSVRVKCS